jgi:DNA polymerase-1
MKNIFNFETNDATLMIVDALNLAYRWKVRPSKTGEPLVQKPFQDDYIATVRSLQKTYKAGKIIVVCDGGSKYRREIYPEYKQHRKDKYLSASQEEQQAFEDFIKEFNNTIEKINLNNKWKTIKFVGVEADDISAYICKNINDYTIEDIWLISSDKDWLLLVDERISQFSYITRKEITYYNWTEHYDYKMEDYLSIKCLQGDAGDNITGIPGIGPVRAKSIVEKYGQVNDILKILPIKSTYKYIQNLNSSEDILIRNKRLIDLKTYCDEAIGNNLESLNTTLKEYL